MTGFYDNQITNLISQSWLLLQWLGMHRLEPWICFGDFNKIMYEWEKNEGNNRSFEGMKSFRATIDSVALSDLGCPKDIVMVVLIEIAFLND